MRRHDRILIDYVSVRTAATEASEAFFYSNRSLSTVNFLVTFNEFLIFNENDVYSCDFADFLIFSDF